MTGPSRLVCVTGMHRSGTSLAARILNLLGVDLGPEDAMMAATEDNPRGYWEAEPISELNDELLRHLGGWWNDVPPLPGGWAEDPSLDRFRERARSLLDELFGGADVAGFKDPRTSLTLPFWRTVTDVSATLLVLRPVDEVCGSLDRREGFEPERSAALWIDHTIAAWIHDPDRVVVTYPGLLADPVAEARRVASAFELGEVTERTAEAIEEFRDPSLRRSGGFDPGGGPQVRGAVALYALLTSGDAPGDVPEGADGVLQRMWNDRDAVRRERQGVEEAERRVAELQREVEEAERRRRDTQAEADRVASERDRARRDAEKWRDEYQRLRERKAVKAALKTSDALRPIVRAVKGHRG
jgi:hypothetical protein